MDLYRVLVADDEEEIREGIIRKIQWEKLGFTVAGSAENGNEALEKAEIIKPDVVMTDIMMPFIDGLELSKKILEKFPGTKIILFSGYDDFEFAQRAIKMHVVEYVLKPINAAELTCTLKKLRVRMDEELDSKRNLELLRTHYEESFPVLREQFLINLIEGRVTALKIPEQCSRYGINSQIHLWTVALLWVESRHSNEELYSETELIPVSVKKIADEVLSKHCKFISFFYGDHIAVLAGFENEDEILNIVEDLNEVCRQAERLWNLQVAAGIGDICTNLNNLKHSYYGAQNALEYSGILGKGKAVFIRDVEPDTTVQLQLEEQEERQFISAVKLGTREEVNDILNAFFKKLEGTLVPHEWYRIYLMEIMTALLKLSHSCQLDVSEVFGEDGYKIIDSFTSIEVIHNWLEECCHKIRHMIRRERIDSTHQLIESAKHYICEHYSESDLSVDSLCQYLHVSPAYFSTIFKKEASVSFVSYLTDVRMQKAVNLLNTTENKAYVIAGQVGYKDPNYFSYAFKKHFGISPSKYRNQPEGAVECTKE